MLWKLVVSFSKIVRCFHPGYLNQTREISHTFSFFLLRMVFSKNKIPLIEHFISEVQKYPAVWDKGSKSYKDVYVKANVWTSILNNLRATFDQGSLIRYELNSLEDLRKQWKSLKDQYQREKKKLLPPSGSGASALPQVGWPFYHQVRYKKHFIWLVPKPFKSRGWCHKSQSLGIFPRKSFFNLGSPPTRTCPVGRIQRAK